MFDTKSRIAYGIFGLLRGKRALITLSTGLIVCFLLLFTLSKFFAEAQTGTARFLLNASSTQVIPQETFTVAVGLDTAAQDVVGVDAVLRFNSDILEVVDVSLGTAGFTTLVPGTNNLIDLTKAVTKNLQDARQSQLEFGLLSFDQSTELLTAPLNGIFDPVSNPIATVTFKALALGNSAIEIMRNQDGTTDANIVIINGGQPEDILGSTSDSVSIDVVTLASPTPTPSPTASPTPDPTPSSTPLSSASPSPSASPCVLAYDFNHDDLVDIRDVMQVTSRWNSKVGNPKYNSLYDTDSDGDIDIVDIQRVVSTWGQRCNGAGNGT